MLMLVVTFVVASTTGFALTETADRVPNESPAVALDVSVSADDVVVTHESGDRLDVAALELVVRRADGIERIPFTEFEDRGDGGGTLSGGETLRLGHGLPPTAVEIRIVHGETVVYKSAVSAE
jgi:hypothetical protein